MLSLIFTILAYGMIPVTFAYLRSSVITKMKYIGICYGLNLIVLLIFIIINGSAVNGGPYILWTYISSAIGVKIMSNKHLIQENTKGKENNVESNVTSKSNSISPVNPSISNNHEKVELRDGQVPLSYVSLNANENNRPSYYNPKPKTAVQPPNHPKRHKNKKSVSKKLISFIIITLLVVVLVAALIIFVIIPSAKYNHAKKLLEEGNCELAYTEFLKLDGYSDSEEMLLECRYIQAIKYRDAGYYDLANLIFNSLGDYRDSVGLIIHTHNYRIVSHIDATCTVAGSEVLECTACKDSYVNYFEASHKYVLTDTTASTCTETGFRSFECTVCHDTYSEILPTKQHSYSSATCTAPKTCSTCGKIDGTPLGHSTGGVACSRCGEITFDTLYYSGTGSKVIEYSVPKGTFKITVTMVSGKASVDVKAHYITSYGDAYEWFLISSAGNSEVHYITGPVNKGSIVVNASSDYYGTSSWKITIEAVGN